MNLALVEVGKNIRNVAVKRHKNKYLVFAGGKVHNVFVCLCAVSKGLHQLTAVFSVLAATDKYVKAPNTSVGKMIHSHNRFAQGVFYTNAVCIGNKAYSSAGGVVTQCTVGVGIDLLFTCVHTVIFSVVFVGVEYTADLKRLFFNVFKIPFHFILPQFCFLTTLYSS